MDKITFDMFSQVNICSSSIIKAEAFPRAPKPAYKVRADFGPKIEVLQTSAQITARYTPDKLIGRQIAGCVNLEEKNIAGFVSQFLFLGFANQQDNIYLPIIEPSVSNGQRMC